jgi:hypothetical protein
VRLAKLIFLVLALVLVCFVSKRFEKNIPTSDSLYGDHSLSGPRDEGEEASYRRDCTSALKLWQPLADQGNAAAQNNIGVLYERGLTGKQDFAEALKWYRKAADHGDAKAEWAIGSLYLGGRGVVKNPVEAESWFRKSADQGDAYFQMNLGGIYEEGRGGIKQDSAEALKWYLKASANQRFSSAAQNAIANTYERERNYVEAAKWSRKSAERGDAVMQMHLGDYYRDGKGVNQDWAEAYFWYKVGENNDALGGMLPQEVDNFWDSMSIEKHLTPEQISAVNKRVSEWKPAPAPAETTRKPETK